MEDVFSKGYSNLIVLGSDCPFVDAQLIEKSAQHLESNKLVLGPSVDGGIYLLGISQSNYHRSKFIQLNWMKQSLQESFSQYLGQEIFWLDEQLDIDEELDFKLALRLLSKSSSLSRTLFRILFSFKRIQFLLFENTFNILVLQSHFQRGPPLAA